MAVESSVIPLDDLIFEHRVYLPSVGMILATVTGLDMIRHKMVVGTEAAGRLAVLAPVLVVLALSAATILRNDVWKNIWPDVAKKSPAKARAFVNHGDYLVKAGRSGEAIAWLKRGIELDPANIDAHLNLGLVFERDPRLDEPPRVLARKDDLLLYPYRIRGMTENVRRKLGHRVLAGRN